MVIPVNVILEEIARYGKEYPWVKPACCPACHGKLWWHGFVLAYFACFNQALYLRRLYCPFCKSVHRLRPNTHWSRYQSSRADIEQCIAHRVKTGRWRPDLPRGRQRQWWRRLRRMTLVQLGLSFAGTMLEAFQALLAKEIIPVASVI